MSDGADAPDEAALLLVPAAVDALALAALLPFENPNIRRMPSICALPLRGSSLRPGLQPGSRAVFTRESG